MDVEKFFKVANEVEDLIFEEGLKEFDKLTLFNFLFDNHIKGLIRIENLSEEEVKQLKKDIKEAIEILNNLTTMTIDREE